MFCPSEVRNVTSSTPIYIGYDVRVTYEKNIVLKHITVVKTVSFGFARFIFAERELGPTSTCHLTLIGREPSSTFPSLKIWGLLT